jgi:hypothetical protein
MSTDFAAEARRLAEQLYGVDAGIDETRHNHQVLAAALQAAYDAGKRDGMRRILTDSLVPEYDGDKGAHTIHACVTYGDGISLCAGSAGVFATLEEATHLRDIVVDGAIAAAEAGE